LRKKFDVELRRLTDHVVVWLDRFVYHDNDLRAVRFLFLKDCGAADLLVPRILGLEKARAKREAEFEKIRRKVHESGNGELRRDWRARGEDRARARLDEELQRLELTFRRDLVRTLADEGVGLSGGAWGFYGGDLGFHGRREVERFLRIRYGGL